VDGALGKTAAYKGDAMVDNTYEGLTVDVLAYCDWDDNEATPHSCPTLCEV
jgi:hypothetical protein